MDEALEACPDVRSLVYQRTGADVPWTNGRDLWWHEEAEKWYESHIWNLCLRYLLILLLFPSRPAYYPPESMNSEDPMFLLYTSGSTGKPKGLMHTTGGMKVIAGRRSFI